MAYPSDKDDGIIQFKQLGGLNQKFSPHALPSPDFSYVHGLYQERAGALERIPGIELLAQAGDGTAAVWNIFQPNDGTDNIIVQTSDGTERVYTLNELFDRTVISDLTYSPLPDDEDMPTAIILQDAANGVDGGSIGASENTWYTRELTSNPLNEDSIVVTFTSGASGSFVLAPGTYRFRGFVSCVASADATGSPVAAQPAMSFQAAINNTTDGTTVTVGSPGYYQSFRGASNQNDLGPVTLYSFFDDTATFTSTNKTLNVQNAFKHNGTANTTFTFLTGTASDVSATLNGAAVRQPYMKIIISKIA